MSEDIHTIPQSFPAAVASNEVRDSNFAKAREFGHEFPVATLVIAPVVFATLLPIACFNWLRESHGHHEEMAAMRGLIPGFAYGVADRIRKGRTRSFSEKVKMVSGAIRRGLFS